MADPLLITNARVITPAGVVEDGWVQTDGRRILAVGRMDGSHRGHDRLRIDARGDLLGPGLIDLHTHGAVGHDVMDGTTAALSAIRRFLAMRGVTSFLATTWSAAHRTTLAALNAIQTNLGSSPGGATLLGANLEGPYLNPSAAGAQDPAAIRPVNGGELHQLLSTGVVRLMTVAPEVSNNIDAVAECVAYGTRISVGHTAATFDQVTEAAERGATQITHLFNAMTPLRHREPGAVGAGLTDPRLMCELVADNIHLHPSVIRLALSAKGVGGVLLVSDAVRACGMAEGELNLDGRRVLVDRGAVRLPDGTLAGSTLTLDVALRNVAAATGRQLEDLWATASTNPARAIGIEDRKGSIEAGKDADLTLLDPALSVTLTIAEGNVVYSRLRAAIQQRAGTG